MPKWLPVGAIVIAALALAVAVTRGGVEPRPRRQVDAPPSDPFELDLVRRELERLDDRLLTLEARVAAQGRPVSPANPAIVAAPGQAPAISDSVMEISARLDAIDKDLSKVVVDRALSSDESTTRLRQVIRDEREAVEREERKKWADRRADATREFVTKFAVEVGLSEARRLAVEKIAVQAMEDRLKVFEELRAKEARPEEWREQMNAAREKSDAELSRELSADQLEIFQKRRDEQRRGGGGGMRP